MACRKVPKNQQVNEKCLWGSGPQLTLLTFPDRAEGRGVQEVLWRRQCWIQEGKESSNFHNQTRRDLHRDVGRCVADPISAFSRIPVSAWVRKLPKAGKEPPKRMRGESNQGPYGLGIRSIFTNHRQKTIHRVMLECSVVSWLSRDYVTLEGEMLPWFFLINNKSKIQRDKSVSK